MFKKSESFGLLARHIKSCQRILWKNVISVANSVPQKYMNGCKQQVYQTDPDNMLVCIYVIIRNGRQYVDIIDYFSRFLEIVHLRFIISAKIINRLKTDVC